MNPYTTTSASNTTITPYGPVQWREVWGNVVYQEVPVQLSKPKLKVVESDDTRVFRVSNMVIESAGGVRRIEHYVILVEEAPLCTSCRSLECIHAAAVSDLLDS